jgi:hypothetical protein
VPCCCDSLRCCIHASAHFPQSTSPHNRPVIIVRNSPASTSTSFCVQPILHADFPFINSFSRSRVRRRRVGLSWAEPSRSHQPLAIFVHSHQQSPSNYLLCISTTAQLTFKLPEWVSSPENLVYQHRPSPIAILVEVQNSRRLPSALRTPFHQMVAPSK